MESYPSQYVEHNLPLVLVSGLGATEESDVLPRRTESGARIQIEAPRCRNQPVEPLRQEILNLDGSKKAWNLASLPGPASVSVKWKIRTVGRAYTLPARKAAPLPQSPGAEGPATRNTELHSPLSPLSPSSPVFPDGVFTPLWFEKHQQQVPALYLVFFDLNANESAQDEQLKSDINNVRNALTRSGFKTRFAVVLVSDKSISHAPELEDRIGSIRRATNLDSKTGLFFMPPMSSQAEIAMFVQSMMAALQASCIEYYRDLTKHARRKKIRGPPPAANLPIGGASHSTSTSGWNVRYEVKQGVFAEFRQEMDVAERHYSAAVEELFSLEGGVFETTASWNPRWNEARLLCDSLAFRVLRCQLWTAQTTGAAQTWQNYKTKMKDLIDRRGKGSSTYGWEAWEARWAGVMAQLIRMADVPALQKSVQDGDGEWSVQQLYALPERHVDRLPPFNFLHHPGYWLRLLAKGIRTRWQKALTIPEEDRLPPGMSPASTVARRSTSYDVYLVPEPHEESPMSTTRTIDHAAELKKSSLRAVDEFEGRRQVRMSEQVRLELAEDLVRAERYSDALHVLVHLWEGSTWRKEDWHAPFGRLLRLLSECASQIKSKDTASLVPALTWELLSLSSADIPTSLDLAQCLDTWDVEERIELLLQDKQRLSPIKCAFAFKERESHVGELLQCQLVLAYDTPNAASIQASKLEFKVGTKVVRIQHDSAEGKSPRSQLSDLQQLQEREDGSLETSADLELFPNLKRVLTISLILREAIISLVTDLRLYIETDKFILIHQFTDDASQTGSRWYVEKEGQLEGVLLPHLDAKSINILPKPPKMQILLHGLRKQYYTDEQLKLTIELVNEEAEAVDATIAAQVIGQGGEPMKDFRWVDSEDSEAARSVEGLKASETTKMELMIQGPPEAATFTLTLDLRYTVVSDDSTHLSKTVSVDLLFGMAFEAKFTFAPRLHPDPWPSYFNPRVDGTETTASGITQLWSLGAQITSAVDEPLKLSKVEVLFHEIQGDASCTLHDDTITANQTLAPHKSTTSHFELSTRKFSLDDRRPSHLDLSLLVTWSQALRPSAPSTTTTITIPRLTIPTSEPRVLCTTLAPGVLHYHLENPSSHFLTFALSLEANEAFAFSGAKFRTLSLAPLSRLRVEYRLLPSKLADDEDGAWVRPNLTVMDSFYQKNLKVHPGGEGVRAEGAAVAVWLGKGKWEEEA